MSRAIGPIFWGFLAVALGWMTPAGAAAQAPAAQASAQPPVESPPLVRYIELAFPTQGNVSVIDPQTYMFYIQTQPSRPSADVWVPYDEETTLGDFRRLWDTRFLDDLWVDVKDVPYDNGVVGKHVIFNLEERERVKIVEYVGSDELKQTDIEARLAERGALIRLDSFIEPALIQRIEGILREMLREEGYQFSAVTHDIQSVAGGPKLVNVSFAIDEGPKVKIRTIEFVGNQALDDGDLKGAMEEIKERWLFSFISKRGIYKADKFEEDAERVVQLYREHGYITAQVGDPQLVYPEGEGDTEAESTWVTLRVPITEGQRYRIGEFAFEGNSVVPDEVLEDMFDVETGEVYNDEKVREGLQEVQEAYGAGGYFEFTGFPDLRPRDPEAEDTDEAGRPVTRGGSEAAIVDVTMRFQEGEQYFVNRITFEGNTVTRDNVIRRNMRLFENGVFNTEALQNSLLSINQLGFFQPLDQSAIDVQPTPGADAKVDVKIRVEEQNRNQLTFGAGVSQFEGFFGQLAFTTSNFLGRGESLTLSGQAGSRSQNYQASFTDPFLFDRPITGGIDVFKRELRYPGQFTQGSIGSTLIFGFRTAPFTQVFTNYSYEQVHVTELNEAFLDPALLAVNPFLADSLLIGLGGRRTISKVTPTLIHNTVDHPIFPSTGRKYTLSLDLAGLGGNTRFWNPRVEGVWFLRHTALTSIGLRAQYEYIDPFSGSEALPIFEKLFQGGEFSVRGFDIRTIGPRDEVTGLVLGGNKSLLLNGEYLITIGGPVRLVLFYDAGQVRARGEGFRMDEFKTSTGAEIRFFMPVLNVPFRLIFARNPQRAGVLDNSLQPTKPFVFRFAVGTTF